MIRLMNGDKLAGLLLGDLMILDECALSGVVQADDCMRYRVTAGERLVGKLTAQEVTDLARGMNELVQVRRRKLAEG